MEQEKGNLSRNMGPGLEDAAPELEDRLFSVGGKKFKGFHAHYRITF